MKLFGLRKMPKRFLFNGYRVANMSEDSILTKQQIYHRRYYLENRERILARNKKFQQEHQMYYKDYNRAYYRKHKSKMDAKHREYYEKHKAEMYKLVQERHKEKQEKKEQQVKEKTQRKIEKIFLPMLELPDTPPPIVIKEGNFLVSWD